MQAITVTIGRGWPNDQTMPAPLWNDYVSRTRRAVDAATTEIWAASPYQGLWEGSREEAFVFYGPLRDDEGTVRRLRERLRNLASEYGQEAVGLLVGESELVESYATTPIPATV